MGHNSMPHPISDQRQMHSLWFELDLLESPRAADLQARVQERFDAFIAALPPALNIFARRSSAFDGLAGALIDWRLSTLTPALTGVPWLFWDITQRTPDREFIRLALASVYLGLASIVTDHLVDGQTRDPENSDRLQGMLFHQAKQTLHRHFNASSQFWHWFAAQEKKYTRGWKLERAIRHNPGSFSESQFRAIGAGKAAPPIITIIALAITAGMPAAIPALTRSLHASVLASLLGDDLQDWREDLAEGRLTWFLSRLDSNTNWRDLNRSTEADLQSLIDRDWTDVKCWRETINYLDQAIEEVRDIPCPTWKAFLEKHQMKAIKIGRRALARHLMILAAD